MSRVIIDICHPADVHFFRHIISHLHSQGHETLVSSRNKDVTLELLEEFNLDSRNLGSHYSSIAGKFFGLIKRNRLLRKEIRNFKPDLIMGFASPYAAQMAWLSRIPCITFNDTEKSFLGNTASHPFSKYIVCPEYTGFRDKSKIHRFRGIFEQLYLSPKYFHPDTNIKEKLGLEPSENYIIMRMVAWSAAHDNYPHYLNQKWVSKIISKLSEYAKVFITSETSVPTDFEKHLLPTRPSEFLDVLASSSVCISEGAKTSSECSIMGVPSILMNSAELGSLQKLESSGLLDIQPHPNKALKLAEDYLNMEINDNLSDIRKKNVEKFRKETQDVPRFIMDFIDELI